MRASVFLKLKMNQKKKTSFQPTEEVCPTMINEREFSIKPPLECNMTKLAESKSFTIINNYSYDMLKLT